MNVDITFPESKKAEQKLREEWLAAFSLIKEGVPDLLYLAHETESNCKGTLEEICASLEEDFERLRQKNYRHCPLMQGYIYYPNDGSPYHQIASYLRHKRDTLGYLTVCIDELYKALEEKVCIYLDYMTSEEKSKFKL